MDPAQLDAVAALGPLPWAVAVIVLARGTIRVMSDVVLLLREIDDFRAHRTRQTITRPTIEAEAVAPAGRQVKAEPGSEPNAKALPTTGRASERQG